MPLFRRLRSDPVKGGSRKRKFNIAKGKEGGCGSLTRLCLWSLSENMTDVWTKDYTEKYMDQYSFRYIMGPFNMLPGELVEELLSLLSSRRLLSRAALHLLLLPQLPGLSLASFSGLVTPSLCHIIGVRCPSLLSLDLSGAQQLCAADLCELLGALPRLRSLSLAGTVCDGRVIRGMATHCVSLQHLDVSRCHRLAPAGLLPLAHRPGGLLGLPLRSLLALDIGFGDEEPERVGAAAFLLLALPLLARLALEGLGEACSLIAAGDFAETEGFADRAGVPSLRELWCRRARGDIGGGGEGAEQEFVGRKEAEQWTSDAGSEEEDEDEEDGTEGEGAEKEKTEERRTASEGQRGRSGATERQVILCLREAQGVAWGALGALGQLCPELCSIALSGEGGPGGQVAMGLGQWAGQLHSLSLQFSGALSQVLPATRTVGATLTTLSLEGVKMDGSVAFLQLLRVCPKLKALHIHTEAPSSAEDEEEEDQERNLHDLPCLPQLLSLTLNFLLDQRQTKPAMSWRSLKWALLALLGGSPLLEKVFLAAIPCPMDSVFRKVLESCYGPPADSKLPPLRRLHHLKPDSL
ncbi:hypothetical protein AAFF_G00023610 [Aldrovandia affinis]|uniref:Uncharacterized protein n=1 Tax=Aldrovandia affinis TaxID=143900 RepID=A0AAD7WZN7_9TELE|nr:hypothetical protein AAFF_G00023610 [Aldrovandia affinis]